MVSAGQMWFSWVSQGIQGLSQGSVKMPIKMSYGSHLKAQLGRGLLSSLLTWLLPRLSSSQAVGWIKASVPCWQLVKGLPHCLPMGLPIGQPTAWQLTSTPEDRPQEGRQSFCNWSQKGHPSLSRTLFTGNESLGPAHSQRKGITKVWTPGSGDHWAPS